MYPDDLKYTNEHEWVRLEGDTATVGITDFAQKQLGDVVFVELPAVGKEFARMAPFGTIEAFVDSEPVRAWLEMMGGLNGTAYVGVAQVGVTTARNPIVFWEQSSIFGV